MRNTIITDTDTRLRVIHRPEIGMGATFYVGSDRYAYTIIEVKSPRRVVVAWDELTIIVDESPNEIKVLPRDGYRREHVVQEITLRKNGRWYEAGTPMKWGCWEIGYRDPFHDPGF